MKNVYIILLILLSTLLSFGQGLKTDGKKIVDQDGNNVLLKGIGLGGWMLMEGYMMQSSDVADTQHEFRERLVDLMGQDKTDTFFDTWLDNHVTKDDVDSLAAWGYNSIRLPMHYNLFTLPIEDEPVSGENTWLTKGFNMVDSLLSWCEQNNMYLILDLHAAPGGQGENAAICDYDPDKPSLWESQDNRNKTVALWAKLAKRYTDEPWIGGYDLLNEVNWNLSGNTQLRALYEEITDSIRAVDTSHIIFIEGNWFANDFTGLTPPWDDNMSYSFHKYWNYNDPGSISWALDLRNQYNIPLWMGESGENSNVWFTDAIELFEDNNIGWSFWPYKRIETIVAPYSILFTDGYKDILSYWRNEGPKPTVDEAYNSMMELATNANSINCDYRKDVHDAQIRQPRSNNTIPYGIHNIPGLIYLSNFDLGKLNHAYYDMENANYSLSTGFFTAWNNGWVYRNDGVDIESNTDTFNSNGFHIAYSEKGEWMKYTVNISESGVFQAKVRFATSYTGGKFHLSIDDEDITTSEQVTSTGSWTDFSNFEINDLVLNEGEHVLKFEFDNNTSINVGSIEFLKTGDPSNVDMLAINGQTKKDEKSITIYTNQPVFEESMENIKEYFSVKINGNPVTIEDVYLEENKNRSIEIQLKDYMYYTDIIYVSYDGTDITSTNGKVMEPFSNLRIRNILPPRFKLPTIIQAEDFSDMLGLAVEETTDVGGGYNIGYTNPGDYADYLIYSSDTSSYEVNLRVAAQNTTGRVGFYILNEDGSETELVNMITPKTGGWQTWTTTTATLTSPIPKGIQTLRMRPLIGEINLNWYRFDILEDIVDLSTNKIVNIYPNPISGENLNIDLIDENHSEMLIQIFDISGRLKYSEDISAENEHVDIPSHLIPRGISVLKIIDGSKSYGKKIIRY
ncbi:MAG: carbohydrate-binding protein [Lentimicrobiaceae bacterium]|jgi:hypothetical protein|nr:carbohydrate-binding protein [Lentimicrobiaceae bacterium]MBT6016644.1 carbohydrate-binding protein [Lentimicrobiaceae bacterium]